MKDISRLVTGHIRHVHGQVYQQANDQLIGWVRRGVYSRVDDQTYVQAYAQIGANS